MGGTVMSRLIIVGAGLLYPAYSSFKAVKSTNAKQYAHWIMYWVVFALYSSTETFTDIFLSWVPLYYELKVLFVLWLSLPYTKGSKVLYRKFVHPHLSKREQDIELFLETARRESFNAVINASSKGINLAANVMVTAAVTGQRVVSNKLRSRSVMDLSLLQNNQTRHQHTSTLLRMNSSPAVIKEVLQTSSNKDDKDEYIKNNNLQSTTITHQYNDEFYLKERNDDELDGDDCITYTLDDMEIVKRTNPNQDSKQKTFLPHYCTMPRLRRNSKTNRLPPLPSINESSPPYRIRSLSHD